MNRHMWQRLLYSVAGLVVIAGVTYSCKNFLDQPAQGDGGRIPFEVVGNMPPHAIGFEVIVRPQEQGFTANGLLIRYGDLIGARRHHRVQQAQRGIGAEDAFVDLSPFLVQIAVGVT